MDQFVAVRKNGYVPNVTEEIKRNPEQRTYRYRDKGTSTRSFVFLLNLHPMFLKKS
jgi:hypothetical protein